MEIRLEDYISEDEMKEIATEEFRNALKSRLRTEQDVERILTNMSCGYVYDMVNDVYRERGVDFEQMLIEKIKGIISDLSIYSVFRERDRFVGGNSVGQDMLEKAVKDNREHIEERVFEIIENYDFKELKEEISDTIYECVMRKFERVAK